MPNEPTMTAAEFEDSIYDVEQPPRCEFCGTDERLHDDHGVLLCIPCSAECLTAEYPRVVAFAGAVVAGMVSR